jgi:toxin YoeB
MEIKYTAEGDEDLEFWKKSGNKIVLKRIAELTKSILIDPYTGIGKPEPLKYNFAGFWSRRITDEHRLIYEVDENIVYIHSLRGHYY